MARRTVHFHTHEGNLHIPLLGEERRDADRRVDALEEEVARLKRWIQDHAHWDGATLGRQQARIDRMQAEIDGIWLRMFPPNVKLISCKFALKGGRCGGLLIAAESHKTSGACQECRDVQLGLREQRPPDPDAPGPPALG